MMEETVAESDKPVVALKKKGFVTLGSATPVELTNKSQWAAGAKIIAEDTTGQSLDEARFRVLEAGKEKRRKELLKKK